MPSRICGSLSIHSTAMPASCAGSARIGPRCGVLALTAAATGTSTENTEPRPGSDFSTHRMPEHAADPLDDRETETETARDPCALLQAMKFAEDRARLRRRDSQSGIADFDAQRPIAAVGSRPARDPSAYI